MSANQAPLYRDMWFLNRKETKENKTKKSLPQSTSPSVLTPSAREYYCRQVLAHSNLWKRWLSMLSLHATDRVSSRMLAFKAEG